MADISKITTPDGNEYNIKDTTARNDIGNVHQYASTDNSNYRVLLSSSADDTTTLGIAHKSGYLTFNPYTQSLSLGFEAYASGKHSFAMGHQVSASGDYSFAMGSLTSASGIDSHAEGYYTTASGSYSHAEGEGTWAKSWNSHAEGQDTIAHGRSQHVFGEFNISDPNNPMQPSSKGKYIEIVGNGSDTNNRSNARTLDWNGNETIAGDLTFNGTTSLTASLASVCTVDTIYPVGSIYISVNNVNPGTYMTGTTWEAFATGKTLIGVDPNDTDFNTIEKTGGVKSVTLTAAQSGVPSHGHTYTRPTVSSSGKVTNGITGGSHTHQVDKSNAGAGVTTWGLVRDGAHGGAVLLVQNYSGSHYNVQSTTHTHDLPNHTHTLTGGGVANNTAANASEAHTNLQPYITVYMWKRTA